MDYHLQELEKRSLYVLREARAKFKNTAVLCSTGKDSVLLLSLSKKAFFGKIPFPVIYLSRDDDLPETCQFRDGLARELSLDLAVIKTGHSSDRLGSLEALEGIIKKRGIEALAVPLRRKPGQIEEGETYFSPIGNNFQRVSKDGSSKTFNSISDFRDALFVRVHPLLDWQELDVWQYIKEENIPVNPLYFAKDGKRYCSIGYPEEAKLIDSNARTIEDIIKELKANQYPKGQDRFRDKEKEEVMERLRKLGYM